MGKFIAHFLFIAIALLAMSFAVFEHEGEISAFQENRWAARRDPGDRPLRYVLFSNPGPADTVLAYERRHFGWPLAVLYVDTRSQDGTWYAKLDVYKLAANFGAACVAAIAIAASLAIRRRRRGRSVAVAVQT